MNDYPLLGSPLKLGPKTARNRIWMTAHATLLVKDHLFTDQHIAYYTARAKGGAAVITMEAFLVTKSFLVLLLSLVIHLGGYLACLREPRFFDLWMTKLAQCPRGRNHAYWRCNSYCP